MNGIYGVFQGMIVFFLGFESVLAMSELAHIVYTKDFLRYKQWSKCEDKAGKFSIRGPSITQ